MLLLADVIWKFRNSSFKILDYVWHIIWAHQLNMTKVDFELMLLILKCRHLLFQQSKKGGISYISKRYN